MPSLQPSNARLFRRRFKLDMLNGECDKCGRRGRYHLYRLIERYGIGAKLSDWFDEITADRPRKHCGKLYDQCGARCPDLVRSKIETIAESGTA